MAEDFNNMDDLLKQWLSDKSAPKEASYPKKPARMTITVYLSDGSAEEFPHAMMTDAGTRIIVAQGENFEKLTVFTEHAVSSYEAVAEEVSDAEE